MKTQAISINQQTTKQNQRKAPVFKGLPETFLAMQENLSYTRFFQDTATNWVPKAIFARSLPDFTEMSFLEFVESALFYFAPALVGEYLLRKGLFSDTVKGLIHEDLDKETSEALKKHLNTELIQDVDGLKQENFLAENAERLLKKYKPDQEAKQILENEEIVSLAKKTLKEFKQELSEENIIHIARNILKEKTELIQKIKPYLEENKGLSKKLLPIKAAIVLGCVGIPAAEYALSFAKNLLTLKLFNKADFNNIANLNKDQKEDDKLHKKVETSAKSHLKSAAIVTGGALVASFIFAGLGHKSKTLQKASEYILQPGAKIYEGLEKLGVQSKKLQNFLKTYINFDFDSSGGKLALSKGQLAATVIAGVFGYHAAAKDRGKLDEKEMLSRVPLVAFYTIFGSSIFDRIFKGILLKANKFTDLIKKGPDGFESLPKTAQLKELAETIASKTGNPAEKELKRLTKESAIIQAVPFGFSLVFMGFLLSGINRFWTQQRYNALHKNDHNIQNEYKNFILEKQKPTTFKCFS